MREHWRQLWTTTTGRLLLVAAAYYVSGRLGLLLAVPPGYATAVWPPSGFALAGVLHFGHRVWPGVWLGSFGVNLALSGAAADPAAQWTATVMAAVIGLGAAAQAVAGAWLVRRWVGYPTALAREGEVFRFVLLAGPVSCLINATWGVGLLVFKGLMPWANVPFNWLTWWVGDTIGVLIFTPLVMVFNSAPEALWRRRRTTVLVPLAVTFALAVVLFGYSRQWEEERQQAAFEQRAAEISHAFAERLTGYLEVLHSVERFYASSTEVSREEFRTFVGGALQRFPGIRAVGWNPRVAAADRAATEQAARAVLPQFEFTELAPGGRLVRAGERAEYFPAYYLEPNAGNEMVAGYDLGSEAVRREALLRARDTGRAVVTERITLVQDLPQKAGVLVLLPVYEQGFTTEPSPSLAARREKLRGCVLGVFSLAEMVQSSLRGLDRDGLALGLWDIQAGEDARELFATQPLALPTNLSEGLSQLNGHSWTRRHEVGGRSWLLEVRSTQAFLAHSRGWQSWLVLAGGLFFTSLLGMLLLLTTGRTVGIEQIVEERTSALNRINAQLAQEVAGRNEMDLRLRQMNETLEQRVAERTHALKASEQAALNMMADAQAANLAALKVAGELRDSEERIRASLREKEVLLQEIHHRVKNNLQVVCSLLNLQAEHIQHPETLRAFAESRARIQSMALVHEKIYRDTSLASIDFSDYLRELTSQLFHNYKISLQQIALRLELTPVAFSLDAAIPCSLIVNELVSNALKYAFPPGRTGEILVRLGREEDGTVQLEVADNGVGLPAGYDWTQSQSLGLRLVRMLTHQLHGQVHLIPGPGVHYRIAFPLPPNPSQPASK